jgi:hypothetical protein
MLFADDIAFNGKNTRRITTQSRSFAYILWSMVHLKQKLWFLEKGRFEMRRKMDL